MCVRWCVRTTFFFSCAFEGFGFVSNVQDHLVMASSHNNTSGPLVASTAGGSGVDGGFSEEERRRQKRRRQLARKTPEQRRSLLQYQRRHNEKDGRVYYCDYCDLFVSSAQKTWKRHLNSLKHMNAFEAYYEMASRVESVWLNEIKADVADAHIHALHLAQQSVAGKGATTPMHATQIRPGIVVGGVPASLLAPVLPSPSPAEAAAVASSHASQSLPAIRVGDSVVHPGPPPPVIKVAGKALPPPQPSSSSHSSSGAS